MKIDTSKGLIAWFARNSVAANLLMFAIIFAGIYSIFNVQKKIFPDFELKLVQVRMAYPGAAPQEIEEGISMKIEEAIENIQGIKKITSRSNEGSATVSIEIEDDYEALEVLDEIKIQIDAISQFPALAEKPLIYEQKVQRDVIWVTLYGDMDERTMKELSKDVRDEIAQIPGISQVQNLGDREYEISIEVSEFALREYGLTLDQVAGIVRQNSLDLPGGAIKSAAGDILLRTKGQAYTGSEFANIVLLTRPDGSRLYLRDVAAIQDGFEERENFSNFDDKPATYIRVQSVGKQNDLEISRAVNAYVERKQKQLPSAVKIAAWGDSAYYLQDRLDLMTGNMWFGALLVFLILALFLRLKLAFWVMLGLPISFLGALGVMGIVGPLGLSINMITLFGFILVLGVVVDDAIIIGESAWTSIEKRGHSIDSVIYGAKEVAMPATFGVLTTIVAFIPMLLVPGPSSPIWASIGWIVILCLIFSLVESKWILPAHLAHMKIKDQHTQTPGPLTKARRKVTQGLDYVIENGYQPFLKKCVRYRYIALSTFIGVFIFATVGLVGGNYVRFVFFPDIPSDFLQANVTMNDGTASSTTIATVKRIENALREVDRELSEEYGQPVVKHIISWTNSATNGQMFVELEKGENREIDGFEILNRWREKVGVLSGVKETDFNGANSGGGAAIAFQLIGKDFEELDTAAQELKDKLATYEGIFDINDSFSSGKEEISLSIKPEAEALGLTLSNLANQVRQGFFGAEVQRILRDKEEVKVMVRYPASERRSITDLENMRVRTASGEQVPFSSVADFRLEKGYSTITRVDGSRSVSVTTDADKSIAEPGKIVSEIQSDFLPKLLQKYPSVRTSLDGQSQDQNDSLVSLMFGFLAALLAIYILMAVALKSYSKPVIVMSAIPFGIIGAIVGHLVHGLSISILSMCGIIALSGVVVNDSLIMVEFVSRARKEGLSLLDAVLRSGASRFRAIVLTSLTTFFGLLPIVLEKSLQAQIVIPMAVSLAYGIVFSTMITLIWVPCLYIALSDLRDYFRKVFQAQKEVARSLRRGRSST